ncbi:Uncharacterized protein TCM_018893 [Theobroma cacao]|uniref:Rapid ALkalinization Factor n=1 Tax=Theobroma cacao TaxID=3641 RepID=A0A061EGI4_THECC|nr:Uncharacterized protein TCM_018893 [Theobroma cacao]
MGDNQRRGLLLAILITMMTVSINHCAAASLEKKRSSLHCNSSIQECFLSEEDEEGLDLSLVESETSHVFPDQASASNSLNNKNVYLALFPDARCGRNDKGGLKCTPPGNHRIKPPHCNNPYNRECGKQHKRP